MLLTTVIMIVVGVLGTSSYDISNIHRAMDHVEECGRLGMVSALIVLRCIAPFLLLRSRTKPRSATVRGWNSIFYLGFRKVCHYDILSMLSTSTTRFVAYNHDRRQTEGYGYACICPGLRTDSEHDNCFFDHSFPESIIPERETTEYPLS